MTSRKAFLNAGALAALLPAMGASPSPAPAVSPHPAPTPTIPPFRFDLAAFDAGAAAKTAAHRHMFAAHKIAGGQVLDTIKTVIDAYVSVGTAASSVATAAVLYHGASIALAFDDSVWHELLVPAIAHAPAGFKDDVAPYKSAKGNPFRQTHDADAGSVETLAAGGTRLYVCNHAAAGFAQFVARANGITAPEAYARFVKGLLPGASLVPAGVWAVCALQERGYTYEQVNL